MEMATATMPAQGAADRSILQALRDLGGRATVGDVVAATGIARETTEQSLRQLLEGYRGHLAVGESGDLLYAFEPKLIRRDHVSRWSRFKSAAKRFLSRAFKVWIVVMLVVYFVIFVALLIAAFVAMMSRGDDRQNGGGGGRRGGGGFRLPTFWLWHFFWTPNWHYGQPYYGHRFEKRSRDGKSQVPFYKKVFAFVFGPDEPRPTQEQLDRSKLRLIRSRRGVLTTAELVEHTGLPVEHAGEELARLVGAYGGDVRVSTTGELVYIFPDLMVSAHGRVKVREPEPAWRRLEHPRVVTGNKNTTDLVIGGLNGFNLVAAATAPWIIFPRLGIGGPLADAGLVWIPLVFSALFFAVPLARYSAVKRDNSARRRGNIRKVMLAHIYRQSLTEEPVTLASLVRAARALLDDDTIPESDVDAELQRLAVEYDADITAGADGATEFRFPSIRKQFEAAEQLRQQLKLERHDVGRIVYSSADSPEQAGRRELGDFDRELQRYVPAPESVAYVDDFEVIEFDEELKRMQAAAGS